MNNKCEEHYIDSIQFDRHILSNYCMLIPAVGTDCDMVPDIEVFTIMKGERGLWEKHAKEIYLFKQ